MAKTRLKRTLDGKEQSASSMKQELGSGDSKDEIEKFNRLAEIWWDRQGSMKPLHAFNAPRLRVLADSLLKHGGISGGTSAFSGCLASNFERFDAGYAATGKKFEDKLRKPLNLGGLNILDCGAGAGIFSDALYRRGANVYALDPAESLHRVSVRHFQQLEQSFGGQGGVNWGNISCLHGDISRWLSAGSGCGGRQEADSGVCFTKEGRKFADFFDVIVLFEVVEHVDNYAHLIRSLSFLLKPNGIMIISTINKTKTAGLLAITMAEKVLGIMPEGTHSYELLVSPEQLEEAVIKANLEPSFIRGCFYIPGANRFLLATSFDFDGVNKHKDLGLRRSLRQKIARLGAGVNYFFVAHKV